MRWRNSENARLVAIRASQGWEPEQLRFGEPLPLALVLWRDVPLPGPMAYVPRGPVTGSRDDLAHALLLQGPDIGPVVHLVRRERVLLAVAREERDAATCDSTSGVRSSVNVSVSSDFLIFSPARSTGR